jgi:hypothetical protein
MLGQLRVNKNSSIREEPAGRPEAKAAHDAPVAQISRQNEEQRQERSRFVEEAVAALISDVLPIVETAAAAFRKKNINTKITKDFDVKNYIDRKPSVVFRCLGPKAIRWIAI